MPANRGGFLRRKGRKVGQGRDPRSIMRSFQASRKGSSILKRIEENKKANALYKMANPKKAYRKRRKYSGGGGGRVHVQSYDRKGKHGNVHVGNHYRGAGRKKGAYVMAP